MNETAFIIHQSLHGFVLLPLRLFIQLEMAQSRIDWEHFRSVQRIFYTLNCVAVSFYNKISQFFTDIIKTFSSVICPRKLTIPSQKTYATNRFKQSICLTELCVFSDLCWGYQWFKLDFMRVVAALSQRLENDQPATLSLLNRIKLQDTVTPKLPLYFRVYGLDLSTVNTWLWKPKWSMLRVTLYYWWSISKTKRQEIHKREPVLFFLTLKCYSSQAKESALQ